MTTTTTVCEEEEKEEGDEATTMTMMIIILSIIANHLYHDSATLNHTDITVVKLSSFYVNKNNCRKIFNQPTQSVSCMIIDWGKYVAEIRLLSITITKVSSCVYSLF